MTVKEFMNSLVCVKVYPTLVYFVFEKCTVRATIGKQRKLFNWLVTPASAPAMPIQGWEPVNDILGKLIDNGSNSFEDSFSKPKESVIVVIENEPYTIPVYPGFACSANEQARSEQYPLKEWKSVNFAELMGLDNDN